MIVNLSVSQYDVLHDLLKEGNLRDVLNKAIVAKASKEVLLEIDEKAADEIRDSCIEALQVVGFDETYELTKKGRVLEELIDKFNT